MPIFIVQTAAGKCACAVRLLIRQYVNILKYLLLQTLIVDLARSLDEHQDAASLQIAVLSFVNAIINYKAGEVSCNLMYVQRRFIRTMIAVALSVIISAP